MPQNDETAASGQDDTCDCLVCAIRRATRARYGDSITQEDLKELVVHLGYASGAFLSKGDGEAQLVFIANLMQAQDEAKNLPPRGTKH